MRGAGGEERKEVSEKRDTERRTFWSQEGRKDACPLCMFSLVINNLWKTVLATRHAEGCFREVSWAEAGEGWQDWGSGRNPAVDWDAFKQLICQSTWVKYFLNNFICLLFCWGNDEG